jgi:hypothetical protein
MVYPTLGFRYFSDSIWGIEGSIFLWGQNGGKLEKRNLEGTKFNMNSSFPHFWAFAVRAGLPLRPVSGKRLSWLIIPDVGFATGAGKEESDGNSAEPLSISYVGSRVDVGVRSGIEARIGPLALQLSIGVYLFYESRATKFTDGGGWDFRTNDLWFSWSLKGDITDTTNIALLYYFD